MPISQAKLEQILRSHFPNADLQIIDTAGDQDHYSVTIADQAFAGKSRIEQHKMVNAALKNELGGILHAMQLKTVAK